MVSPAEKTNQPSTVAQQKTQQQPFFKKAEEGSFFGSNEQLSFFRHPVQAKLDVSHPEDPLEKEADAMADHVMRMPVQQNSASNFDRSKTSFFSPRPLTKLNIQRECTSCEKEKLNRKEEKPEAEEKMINRKENSFFEGLNHLENSVQRKCTECEKEEKMQKKSDSTPQTASPNIESNLSSSKGPGSPLPHNTREQMESSFGIDFSNVRIHTGSNAVQLSKDLNAQAFTRGNDIYFNSGKYDDSSNSGKHLLAHELTHTMQQGGVKRKIQRTCDPSITSCTPRPKNNCDPSVASCPPMNYSDASTYDLQPDYSNLSFSLSPILNPPPEVLASIQEGSMETFNASPVPSSFSGTLGTLKATEFISPGSSVLLTTINQTLMQSGFSPIAGGNGIGMIAIPRLGTAGGLVPETLNIWGHTATYVRINGQIRVTSGFTVESLTEAAMNMRAVPAGTKGIGGTISNDISMFTATNARTIEWPVSQQVAQQAADTLPQAGPPPAGIPSQYTGRPGVPNGPVNAGNCVGFACNATADSLGGKPSTPKLGNVAEPMNATEGLQGRMMQLTKTAASDISPQGAVVSGMPMKFVILKWGGRLFMVLGAALTVKQVLEAQGEHRREQQGQATGSFAGGVALGAFGAGLCIGLGFATMGAVTLLCGIGAGLAGALGGHYAGGAIGRQFD